MDCASPLSVMAATLRLVRRGVLCWTRVALGVACAMLGAGALATNLLPGVPVSIDDLFPETKKNTTETGLTIASWSLGLYFNCADLSPPVQVTGDAPWNQCHLGTSGWGYNFLKGEDPYWRFLESSQGADYGVEYSGWGGTVTLDPAFTGTGVNVGAVLQRQVLTGQQCAGYPCFVRQNVYVGSLSLTSRGPVLVNPMPIAWATHAFGHLDPRQLLGAPVAKAFAADGRSAAVVIVPSRTPNSTVTIGVEPAGSGSLTPYDPAFLTAETVVGTNPVQVTKEAFCDGEGASRWCYYFALLWPPDSPPPAGDTLNLLIRAGQPSNLPTTTISVIPSPVVFVHGIWSSAEGAGFSEGNGGMRDWLATAFGHDLMFAVDYENFSAKSFADPNVQALVRQGIRAAMSASAENGAVARRVDVVTHSMGGLATRRFIGDAAGLASLPPDPIRRLVTIGTPHFGSALATELVDNANAPIVPGGPVNAIVDVWCTSFLFVPCTLARAFDRLGRPLDTGALSLRPGNGDLDRLPDFPHRAIVGTADQSNSEGLLNRMVSAFLPGNTIDGLLGSPLNDTIVTRDSQIGPAPKDVAEISGVVHTSLVGRLDDGETASPDVWRAVYTFLTNRPAPPADAQRDARADAAPLPFDVGGATEVSATHASLVPPGGASLALHSVVAVGATSATKVIRELRLFPLDGDPTKPIATADTQAPFALPIGTDRLGRARFLAVVFYDDATYSTHPLEYDVLASSPPVTLSIRNAPSAPLAPGERLPLRVMGNYTTGTADVTAHATFTLRDPGTPVLVVEPSGTIIGAAYGSAWIDVSHDGRIASLRVDVAQPGHCAGFADVPASSAFCASVAWLRNRNVTAGCGPDSYCGSDEVSRLQMAAFMQRLGRALTPVDVWREEAPGALTLSPAAVVCETPDITVDSFARRADVRGRLQARADSTQAVRIEPTHSRDGGGTWAPLSALPHRAGVTTAWTSADGRGYVDVSPGERIRFALRLTTNSGTGSASIADSQCALLVRLTHRDGRAFAN